jgi:GT2 family glycosyltransferase
VSYDRIGLGTSKSPQRKDPCAFKAPPLASLVVLNWNGLSFIEACLRSIVSQTYKRFELVVVDNHSTDGSRELLQTRWKNRIRLVALDRNLGYCGGNNRGMAVCRGELIVLLNNDVTLDPCWLSEIVTASVRKPEAGMFASKILCSRKPGILDSAGLLLYPDGVCRSRGWLEPDRDEYSRETEVLAPNGAVAVYRRSMLEKTGEFDETYFAFLEDLDLGMRGQLLGFSCFYVPTAVAYHEKSVNFGNYSKQKAFLVERNRVWNLIKLFPSFLILVSPAFTAYRYILQFVSAISLKGSAGQFVRRYSRFEALGVLVRSIIAAFSEVPQMARQRRLIQRTRKLDKRQYNKLIGRFKLPAAELVFKE